LAIVSMLWTIPLAAQAPASDADLARGIAQVHDGDFETAVATLGGVVRRLAPYSDRAKELAQAHLYLGIAYAQLDDDKAARASFREALALDASITIDPSLAAAKVVRAFDAAKPAQARPAAAPTAPNVPTSAGPKRRQPQPAWVSHLLSHPIVEGESIAGVSRGQTRDQVVAFLGEPSGTHTPEAGSNETRIWYELDGLALSLWVDKRSSRVRRLLFSDDRLNAYSDLPTVRGAAIGGSSADVLAAFGPANASSPLAGVCPASLEQRDGELLDYPGPGIYFLVCKADQRVYGISVKSPGPRPGDSRIGVIVAAMAQQGARGVRVEGLLSGGPADTAGVRSGDTISSVDGVEVNDVEDFTSYVRSLPVGTELRLLLLRGKKKVAITVRTEAVR